jgi:hypothetical protein
MRGPLIDGKDFQLPLNKEASSRRGTKEERSILFFLGENKGKMEV